MASKCDAWQAAMDGVDNARDYDANTEKFATAVLAKLGEYVGSTADVGVIMDTLRFLGNGRDDSRFVRAAHVLEVMREAMKEQER